MKFTGNRKIIAQFKEQINKNGRISFEEFIAGALYHPSEGYYSSKAISIGGSGKGDFTTCVTINPLLGKAIANWTADVQNRNKTNEITVIELGGGTGALAKDILENISVETKNNFSYFIVEINSSLIKLQKEKLQDFHGKIYWFNDIQSALNNCKNYPILIANEFVDTFPARVLQWINNGWLELFFIYEDSNWVKILNSPSPPIDFDIPLSLKSAKPLRFEQQVEIQTSFWNWWNKWNNLVKKATFLIIDYGDIFPEIYHRRPKGTIRGYFKNNLVDGKELYQRIGYQDLTVDINFSDLMLWAQELGWEKKQYMEQQTFIKQYKTQMKENLPKKKKSEVENPLYLNSSEEFIQHPFGAGSCYKMLIIDIDK